MSFFVSFYSLFFFLDSVFSNISIAILAFFSLPLHDKCFSKHPFTFNLYESLGLQWVFLWKHIDRSCFFNPFHHPMSFDWSIWSIYIQSHYWKKRTYCHFVTCFVVVFVVHLCFLLLLSSLLVCWLSLVIYLYYFLFIVCISITGSLIVVSIRFTYNILCI